MFCLRNYIIKNKINIIEVRITSSYGKGKKNLETRPVFFTPYVLSFKRFKTDFDKTKGDKNMS
jgi:hypothetical protein